MIPFSPPRIDEKIKSAVIEALDSGWITTGPKTKQFEIKLAEYCSVEKVLATNSWTAGAEMILHWFGIKAGDEVIIPAYTYCATANIIIHCGAKPVMVDVGNDFCINTEQVRQAITSKTKAIIPVDLGGLPANYQKLKQIIEDYKSIFSPNNSIQEKMGRIMLLADAAHSFGALYRGNPIGKDADFTVFSFHAVKNLTTAEGGGICINLPNPFSNVDIYNELNILSLHGQSKDALAKTQKGAWEYDVNVAGFKCNMTDILASIGLVELERYNRETLLKREEIFKLYSEKLIKYSWATLPIYHDEERRSACHLYLLIIKNINRQQRDSMIKYISENDVSVNVHYKPLPELSYYKNLGYDIKNYPVSKQLWEAEISLPIYFDLTIEQVNIVVEVLVAAYYNAIK